MVADVSIPTTVPRDAPFLHQPGRIEKRFLSKRLLKLPYPSMPGNACSIASAHRHLVVSTGAYGRMRCLLWVAGSASSEANMHELPNAEQEYQMRRMPAGSLRA